jgi:hypothetical protein
VVGSNIRYRCKKHTIDHNNLHGDNAIAVFYDVRMGLHIACVLINGAGLCGHVHG